LAARELPCGHPHVEPPETKHTTSADAPRLLGTRLEPSGPVTQRTRVMLPQIFHLAQLPPRLFRDQIGFAHRDQPSIRKDVSLTEGRSAHEVRFQAARHPTGQALLRSRPAGDAVIEEG